MLLKIRKLEDLMRRDWHQKLIKENIEITPEMGRPQRLSKKQFVE